MNVSTVGRAEFISRYMRDLGVTYSQAQKIFEATMAIVEDAVVAGSRIGMGRVGALVPIHKPPRQINMGFSPGGKKVEQKTTRVYYLGSRVDYKFRLYKGFLSKRGHEWFPNVP